MSHGKDVIDFASDLREQAKRIVGEMERPQSTAVLAVLGERANAMLVTSALMEVAGGLHAVASAISTAAEMDHREKTAGMMRRRAR